MSIYDLGKLERAIEAHISALPIPDQAVVKKYLNEKTAINKISSRRSWRIVQSLKVLRKQISCNFSELEKDQVLALLCWIEKQKYADYTKLTHEVVLKNFLSWMNKDVSYLRRRKIKKKDYPVLMEEEVQKLLSVCTHPRDKCLIAFLWDTGCRVGEAGEIKISDLTFEKIGVRVNLFGKTGSRAVLTLFAAPYLTKWLNEHPTRSNRNSYVFVAIRGRSSKTQLQYPAIRKLLQILAKKAGIDKKINPHWFRHSRATDMARKRWAESTMRAHLGWSKDSDMPSTYIHLSGRDVDDALLMERGMIIEKNKITPAFQDCPRCNQQNGIAELFCSRCGGLLKLEDFERVKLKESEELENTILKVMKKIHKVKQSNE